MKKATHEDQFRENGELIKEVKMWFWHAPQNFNYKGQRLFFPEDKSHTERWNVCKLERAQVTNPTPISALSNHMYFREKNEVKFLCHEALLLCTSKS